eukprot:scaffold400241_cov55-Prasinocladus_malaysianus.AAC.1
MADVCDVDSDAEQSTPQGLHTEGIIEVTGRERVNGEDPCLPAQCRAAHGQLTGKNPPTAAWGATGKQSITSCHQVSVKLVEFTVNLTGDYFTTSLNVMYETLSNISGATLARNAHIRLECVTSSYYIFGKEGVEKGTVENTVISTWQNRAVTIEVNANLQLLYCGKDRP